MESLSLKVAYTKMTNINRHTTATLITGNSNYFFFSHTFCNTFLPICPSLQKFLVPPVPQIFEMRYLVLCNRDLTRNQFYAI